MSNAAKLKKRAVELEQKKLFDKALPLYIQFLQESEGTLDDIDIPLNNRVGDLLLRMGNATDALNYYEKAVDLYAERGFLNNAIALCNKVLRQSPGRASIYYKLGKISATKGFKSDAKKNFLEYADRMQKTGQINEAFRALKEFADLCPDQDDIRLMLAEQLSKENRQDEALEQLHKLHDKLDSEGRMAEARATADRMKSIDPEAVPRTSGSYRPQKSTDLIFLDTSFEQQSRSRQTSAPPPPPPPPPGRQVSDPDLVVLTLSDQPDSPVSPVHNASVGNGFALDLDEPNESPAAGAPLPLLDADDEIDLPSASDVEERVTFTIDQPSATPPAIATVGFDAARGGVFDLPPEGDSVSDASPTTVPSSVTINVQHDPAPVDLVRDQPTYVSGPPLGVDYASDLAAGTAVPAETNHDDFFDFRAPPRSDDDAIASLPSLTLDPDVAFPSFGLDDVSLPSADEVTSGASLAAALGLDATLGGDVDALDVSSVTGMPNDVVATESESPTTEGSEWTLAPAAPAAANAARSDIDHFAMVDDVVETSRRHANTELVAPDAPVPEVAGYTHQLSSLDGDAPDEDRAATASRDLDAIDVSIDDLLETSGNIAAASSERADVRKSGPPTDAFELLLADSADVPERSTPAPASIAIDTPPAEPSPVAEVAADEVVGDAETERPAGWEVQRSQAERLLEAGDRAAGVQLLEQVAVDLERIGDLERALSIIDELIRLTPDSIRHHQKRVELAFRASDRAKLTDAYIELGDALFRSGEERKARAVYQRVLELAPDDPRARAAVESVASMSPPDGSGAIPTIVPPNPPADARASGVPTRPHARDTHVPYQPGPGAVIRPDRGVAGPPPSRKPSPLDRRVAPNGEFVDLGEWLRSGENAKSTRMVTEEKPPTGDEQADFQEMLKRFKQGVADNVDDEDYDSHYDLGVAYKEMGLMDEAVAEFQKSLRGHANRVRAYEALGQCFVEKEQYQVAASVLSRAIAISDGDDHHLVGVLYLLGRATEALSRHGDALDYYQRVFAVDIEFRDVAERISAIERKAT